MARNFSKDRLLRDISAELENQFSRDRVDAMLFFLHEAKLTEDERRIVKDALIGRPIDTFETIRSLAELVNDDDFVEQYEEYRALGLTKAETARMLGITPEQLWYMLRGEGISKLSQKRLLDAEAKAEVSLKHSALRVIKGTMESGGKDAWRAAIAILEKRFPKEYAKRLEIEGSADLRMSSEACEDAAIKARQMLEDIRASRGESLGIAPEDMHIKPEDYASGPDKRQIELGLEQK